MTIKQDHSARSAPSPSSLVVRASEIGAYAYSPEKWKREQREGFSAESVENMRRGTSHHRRIEWRFRKAQFRSRHARIAMFVVLLGLLWYIAKHCFGG